MAKKEKVSLIRAEDFESVDTELSEALNLLEESNAKVEALLLQEHEPEGFEVPDDFVAPAAKHEVIEDTPAMHEHGDSDGASEEEDLEDEDDDFDEDDFDDEDDDDDFDEDDFDDEDDDDDDDDLDVEDDELDENE